MEGDKLKCAVRLFIQRPPTCGDGGFRQLLPGSRPEGIQDVLSSHGGPITPEIIRTCPYMTVEENDSRITIARQLFENLNSAPRTRHVLMLAKGEHCAFIGVMSIVVANGWSRAISQRVETRVALLKSGDEDTTTVVYITRLVPAATTF
jgi:hypothetical protein